MQPGIPWWTLICGSFAFALVPSTHLIFDGGLGVDEQWVLFFAVSQPFGQLLVGGASDLLTNDRHLSSPSADHTNMHQADVYVNMIYVLN